MIRVYNYLSEILHNHMVMVMAIMIVMDTSLGCCRSIKQHKFNSSFGIDGAIRKTAMILSIMFLMFVDQIIGINALWFLSEETRRSLPFLTHLGLGEFFCLLYILYEATSITKNWFILGLLIPKGWRPTLAKLLSELTEEIPPEETEKILNEKDSKGCDVSE